LFHVKRITPVLRVLDLQATIDYYTEILGFSLHWRQPNDGGGENCMMGLGEVHLLFSTGAHLGSPPRFTGTLYFDMDGVDAYFERVKDRVELLWPLEEMDYGQREFGFKDCNGYTLAFAQATKP
jgi:catechol 2,3-dioxygenase-like lactoylglutathione lyase family enzyme